MIEHLCVFLALSANGTRRLFLFIILSEFVSAHVLLCQIVEEISSSKSNICRALDVLNCHVKRSHCLAAYLVEFVNLV